MSNITDNTAAAEAIAAAVMEIDRVHAGIDELFDALKGTKRESLVGDAGCDLDRADDILADLTDKLGGAQ